MYHIIYNVLTSRDEHVISQFEKLIPTTHDEHTIKYSIILSQINKINDEKIKTFLQSINKKEMELYCSKYIRNAFNFNVKNRNMKVNPVILFNGAVFNHSCIPNVIFSPQDADKKVYFFTTKKIEAGEELCSCYCDLKLNKKDRKSRMLQQYGFKCCCERCLDPDEDKFKEKTGKIEALRKKQF